MTVISDEHDICGAIGYPADHHGVCAGTRPLYARSDLVKGQGCRTRSDFVRHRIGDLTVKGKPIGIEVDGFAGVSNQQGAPATFGFAAIWYHRIVDQLSIVFGIGGSMTGGKLGGGPILGARISF